MRSHYRGHKMSLWLSLIPQLHRPGSDLPDAAMRHHHFQDDSANYYEGNNNMHTNDTSKLYSNALILEIYFNIILNIKTKCQLNIILIHYASLLFP